MVIALTSAGTPLAREATLAITLDVTGRYLTLYAHGFSTCTADRDRCAGDRIYFATRCKFRDNLKRVKEALKESRFDKQLLNLSDDR